ncbi:MAG: hypothetical protein AAF985_25560, partial [Bacteroidota bacterium]
MNWGRFHYIIIATVLIWVSSNLNWGKSWEAVINHDIKGYYAYLPAVFIYQDLQFGFYQDIKDKYGKEWDNADYRLSLPNGTVVNKYYVGTAILEMPFFLLAHGLSGLTGFAQDGYSYLYVVFLCLSSIVYLFIGIFYFEKILEIHGLSGYRKWLVIYALIFGTNAFVYTSVHPGMSHVYSFACINAFIYYFIQFRKTSSKGHFLLLAFLIGWITLIRPVNVIVIVGLLYFLNGSNDIIETFGQLRKMGSHFFLGLLLAIGIGSIQLIIYKLQTGAWIVYSYGEEGFNFSQPEFINFLFSYRKGYFLYTPLALLGLLGLLTIYRKNPFKFWSLSFFLLVLIYILSSWWCWWYGGSFSSRVMLEFSIFLFLPLGLLLQDIRAVVYQRL